jgi:hypothetical protein
MKIKKWIQFIKESKDYWMPKEDIQELFLPFTDVGYIIEVKPSMYSKNFELITQDDCVSTNDEFYIGYVIEITKSIEKFKDDLTSDFRSICKMIESEGYKIFPISDDETYNENEKYPHNNFHFINGSIITWIPEQSGKPLTSNREDFADGDIYVSSSEIHINIYQTESIELTEKDMAEFYDWSNYTTNDRGYIYCELDIEDMAELMLHRNSNLKDSLINPNDSCDNYFSGDYQPDIQSLFSYTLKKDNEILAIKCLIKELEGFEEFIKECDNDELEGKSEEDVIDFLLKERYKKTLEKVCRDSEIIGDIKQTVGDWECQAHCEKNQKEIEEEFDEILVKEGISYSKSLKEGKRFFYKKTERGKEKVYYDEMVWFYKLDYQERWISDHGKTLSGYSLSSVFKEWCYDSYFNYKLNPRFSDWGDVDREFLNKEIESMLKNYLK